MSWLVGQLKKDKEELEALAKAWKMANDQVQDISKKFNIDVTAVSPFCCYLSLSVCVPARDDSDDGWPCVACRTRVWRPCAACSLSSTWFCASAYVGVCPLADWLPLFALADRVSVCHLIR